MNEDATDLRIRRPDEATRRAFITRAVAMGASVAAAMSLWETGARAAAVKGGHLRLGVAGASTTDTLDPSPWSDTFMVMVGYSTRGSLVELAPDGTLRAGTRGVLERFAGRFSMDLQPSQGGRIQQRQDRYGRGRRRLAQPASG